MKLLSAKGHHDLLEKAGCSDLQMMRSVANHGFVPRAKRPPMLARMSCTGLVLSLNSETGR
jgi:hypothetical protein